MALLVIVHSLRDFTPSRHRRVSTSLCVATARWPERSRASNGEFSPRNRLEPAPDSNERGRGDEPPTPKGKEANWIETTPGKGWFSLVCLYSPTKAWYDNTWRPGEIELIN